MIKCCEGFIHQQEPRFGGKRPQDGEALLLAAGELAGLVVAERLQPAQLQQLPDIRLVAGAVKEMAFYRHVREQGIVLEHETNAALLRFQANAGGCIEPDLFVNLYAPLLGADESGQYFEQGGFARAGRTGDLGDAVGGKAGVDLQGGAIVGFDLFGEFDLDHPSGFTGFLFTTNTVVTITNVRINKTSE